MIGLMAVYRDCGDTASIVTCSLYLTPWWGWYTIASLPPLLVTSQIQTRMRIWLKSQAKEQWTQVRILNFRLPAHPCESHQGIPIHTIRRVKPSPRAWTWTILRIQRRVFMAELRALKRRMRKTKWNKCLIVAGEGWQCTLDVYYLIIMPIS